MYPLLGFAISLLQQPLQGIMVFACAEEMSPKNARAVSSSLEDVLVEILTSSCTVVEDTVWIQLLLSLKASRSAPAVACSLEPRIISELIGGSHF